MQSSDQKKILVAIGIFLILGIAYLMYQIYFTPISNQYMESQPKSSMNQQPTLNDTLTNVKSNKMLVHIAGAIKNPGVYEITPNARVMDVIQLAGGALKTANLDNINLARIVKDGERMTLTVKSILNMTKSKEKNMNGIQEQESTNQFPIDLNTATIETLDSIPGIGKVMAKRIIEYRNKTGEISSIDELKNIKGFSQKKIDQIKDYIK